MNEIDLLRKYRIGTALLERTAPCPTTPAPVRRTVKRRTRTTTQALTHSTRSTLAPQTSRSSASGVTIGSK